MRTTHGATNQPHHAVWRTPLPAVSLEITGRKCYFTEESMERRWVMISLRVPRLGIRRTLRVAVRVINVGNCSQDSYSGGRLKSSHTLRGAARFLASCSKFEIASRRKSQCCATGWERLGSQALPTALGYCSGRKFGVLTVLGRGPTAWSKVAPDNLTFLSDHLGLVLTQSLRGAQLLGCCFRRPNFFGEWTGQMLQAFKISPLLHCSTGVRQRFPRRSLSCLKVSRI